MHIPFCHLGSTPGSVLLSYKTLGKRHHLSEPQFLCHIANRTDITGQEGFTKMTQALHRARPGRGQQNDYIGCCRRSPKRDSRQGEKQEVWGLGRDVGGLRLGNPAREREAVETKPTPCSPPAPTPPWPQLQTHPRKAGRTMRFACSQAESRKSCFISLNK
jgi:hypothetical protein